MNKKTILILILVIIVSGAGVWYFSTRENALPGQPGSGGTKEKFSENGTLNKDESVGGGGWVLNYENAGGPRETAILDFNRKSMCDAGLGLVSCSDVDLTDGIKISVTGEMDGNKVSITTLNVLADAENKKVCAQVITTAINPVTGEQKDFPTPCDVPKGWGVLIK